MLKKPITIHSIPAVLWGGESEKVIIAVHGNLSHKADVPIALLAECALPKGYRVLSFDLPEHGDRKQDGTLCNVQNCVKDLTLIMDYAKRHWQHVSLFANSMGAYFSLLAYHNEPLEKALFLSPVVDMRRIIENMMAWFQVTEEQLERQQAVATPIGQTLYWDYYCYVKARPIAHWDVPTCILYGGKDEMCEIETIRRFVEAFACQLRTAPEAEHFFHTPEDLDILSDWLNKNL